MASIQAQAEYLEDAQFVIDELKEFGHPVEFGYRPAPVGRDRRGAFVSVGTANAIPMLADESYTAKSEHVTADTEEFFVSNEVDLEELYELGTPYMLFDGKEYAFADEGVQKFEPDNVTNIFYFLTVVR